jgi:hypothetical protein
MAAITAAFEALRATLRGQADWSDGQVIGELESLSGASLALAAGLRRRQDRADQDRHPLRAADRLSANYLAGFCRSEGDADQQRHLPVLRVRGRPPCRPPGPRGLSGGLPPAD